MQIDVNSTSIPSFFFGASAVVAGLAVIILRKLLTRSRSDNAGLGGACGRCGDMGCYNTHEIILS